MTEQSARGARAVFKGVWLTVGEWQRVQNRMAAAGVRTFAAYARDMLVDGQVVVRRVAFDPAMLRVELSRIGNNINQIARAVNTDDAVTVEQMRATRELLGHVQRAINDAIEAN